MKQYIKDDLLVDGLTYRILNHNSRFSHIIRLYQGLAIFIGSIITIFLFAETFALPIYKGRILGVIFLTTIAFYGVFFRKKYEFGKVVSILLLGALLIKYKADQLLNGFYILENLIIERMNQYFNTQIPKFMADDRGMEDDISLLIGLSAVFVVYIMARYILRKRMKILCFTITILPVVLSFVVGITPPLKYFVAYLVLLIFLIQLYSSRKGNRNLIEGNPKKVIKKMNGKAAVILSLISLLLIMTLQLLYTPAEDTKANTLDKAKSEIQTFFNEFTLEDITDRFFSKKLNLPKRNVTSGGLSGGELGSVEALQYLGTEELRVVLPEQSLTGGLYLKGYVGSEYTGTSWEGHSNEAIDKYRELRTKEAMMEFPFVNQTNQLFHEISGIKTREEESTTRATEPLYEISRGKIMVEYKGANKKYLYAPYHTDYQSQNLSYVQDLYALPHNRQTSYELDFFYNISIKEVTPQILREALGEYRESEVQYRNYIYDVYTRLPEQGLDTLKLTGESLYQNIEGERLQELGETELWSRIQQVKDYLHSNTSYTLSPGALPQGEDFVEYFLYENRLGYCAHYASAGALLLRTMGIPARYVEGYAVDYSNIIYEVGTLRTQQETDDSTMLLSENAVEIIVQDSDAHAWVEVYVDGFGWYPVEFTPGARVQETSPAIQEMDRMEIEAEEEEVEPEEPVDRQEELEQPSEKASMEEEKDEAPVQQPEKDGRITGWFQKVLAILILIIVLSLPVLFLRMRRKKLQMLDTADYSRKALLLYRQIEILLKHLQALPTRLSSTEQFIKEVETKCPYVDSIELADCMEMILKAKYARDEITLEEFQVVESFYKNLYEKIYRNAAFYKKLYIRFVTSI